MNGDFKEEKKDGLFLLGKVPEKWNKKVVLFVHGGGLNYRCGVPIVEFFSNKGFASFTVSLRGHTKSDVPDNFNSTTLDDYKEDIEKIIKHISNTYDVKLKNIYLIAHSLSTLPALKISGLGGLILLSPLFTKEVYELFDYDLAKLYKLNFAKDEVIKKRFEVVELNKNHLMLFFGDEINITKYYDLLSKEPQNTRHQYLVEGYSVDPKDVKTKILILASKNDNLLKLEGQISLAKIYNASYEVLDSSHMIMFDKEWNVATNKILMFINNN